MTCGTVRRMDSRKRRYRLGRPLLAVLSLSAGYAFYYLLKVQRYSQPDDGGISSFRSYVCLSSTNPSSIPWNPRQSKLPVCQDSAWCRCRHRGELLGSGNRPAKRFVRFVTAASKRYSGRLLSSVCCCRCHRILLLQHLLSQ